MTKLVRVGLALGILAGVALAGAEAQAAVTTYALPGQGGVLKNPANDASCWTNTYGRMVHSGSCLQHELDFPLTAIWGATAISGFVNVDVGSSIPIFGGLPKACAQLLVVDPSGTSVISTPVQCESSPTGAAGYTIPTGSITPPPQFYSFVAVWSLSNVTVNSVSYAITK